MPHYEIKTFLTYDAYDRDRNSLGTTPNPANVLLIPVREETIPHLLIAPGYSQLGALLSLTKMRSLPARPPIQSQIYPNIGDIFTAHTFNKLGSQMNIKSEIQKHFLKEWYLQ